MARHRQAPGRVRICVAVRAPPRAPPPAAVRGPAEGYFTRANSSAAAPGCVFLPKRCVRVCTFASFHCIARARVCPLSATVVGSGHAGKYPEICISVK